MWIHTCTAALRWQFATDMLMGHPGRVWYQGTQSGLKKAPSLMKRSSQKLIYTSRTREKRWKVSCNCQAVSVCVSMCEIRACSMCETGRRGRWRQTVRDNELVRERQPEKGVRVSNPHSHPSANTHLGQKCQRKMGEEGVQGEECGRVLRAAHEWKWTEWGE